MSSREAWKLNTFNLGQMNGMRTILLIALAFHFLPLSAAEFKAGEETRISKPVVNDLYASSGELIIAAPLRADLVAAGGSISIEDSVSGDILITGGRIEVSGYCGDDFRAAGGEIIIRGFVRGDVVVIGGSLRLEEGSIIEGDLVVFGGRVGMHGKVSGNVKVYCASIRAGGLIEGSMEIKCGELDIEGNIAGDMRIQAGEIEAGPDARCSGSVRYWTPEGEMDLTRLGTGVVYDKALSFRETSLSWSGIGKMLGLGLIAYWIIFILSVMLVLFIMEYFLSRFFHTASGSIKESFIKCFGYGMLYLLGMPVLIVISFILIIGFPIGILALCLYGVTLLYGTAIIALFATHYFKSRRSQNWPRLQLVLYATITAVILKIVFLIPWLGTLLKTFALASVYGTFLMLFFEKLRPAKSVS